MNITVELSELRAHETAMKAWGLDRAAAALKWIEGHAREDHSMMSGRMWNKENFDREMATWDVAHPVPVLIPVV